MENNQIQYEDVEIEIGETLFKVKVKVEDVEIYRVGIVRIVRNDTVLPKGIFQIINNHGDIIKVNFNDLLPPAQWLK